MAEIKEKDFILLTDKDGNEIVISKEPEQVTSYSENFYQSQTFDNGKDLDEARKEKRETIREVVIYAEKEDEVKKLDITAYSNKIKVLDYFIGKEEIENLIKYLDKLKDKAPIVYVVAFVKELDKYKQLELGKENEVENIKEVKK